MQLEDRGEIAVGKRADLVLVDWPMGQTPAIQGTWVGDHPGHVGSVALFSMKLVAARDH